ncbi:MAG: hypothetical protein B6I24_00790 [Bacteroidetes bacterium 4572_128]|nr:MAG: hypothetical protein B6I24_00790 [Bacteroidetes bacterium 4572_128]
MTLFIIIITIVVSVFGFKDSNFFGKFLFNPFLVHKEKQWYRLLTHGFLHADYFHLAINMFVLFSFGKNAEYYLSSTTNYIFLYFGGMIIASLISLRKHKENFYYNSVGASGAVSAVVFTSIFFAPLQKIYIYGLIGLPGIVLGGSDNINHDAHFSGALFGFLFP